VKVTTGSMDLRLTIKLYPADGSSPVIFEQVFTGLPSDPTVELAFDPSTAPVDKLRLEILNINDTDTAKVHLREIRVER